MTVTYSAKVTNSSLGCFLRLLLRWRGSVYKLLWKEFVVFAVAFFIISLVYRFALNDGQKPIFELIAKYCFEFSDLIPISFVLGFYVTIVVSRWTAQFNQIPWPDRMALFVTANVHGEDERGRLMRRTMMRYLCLSYVITMHSISPGVKRRFPSFSHMTKAGFMLPSEQKVIEDIQTPHNKYFVPLAWATSLISRARKEGRIKDDFAVKTLIDEINAFRGCLGGLFNFDWISIPLVYTQVVTWAVYSFFLATLMGSQTVSTLKGIPVPVFTFLQFFFYMGWLKVAECLVNPFGDDDDDFDMNTVIDRNLQVSYLVVDEMHAEHPELIKDQYWDDVDFDLPYTVATESQRPTQLHIGSAFNIEVSPKQKEFVFPSSTNQQGIERGTLRVRYNQGKISTEKCDSPNLPKARVVQPMGILHKIRRNSSRISQRGNTDESPDIRRQQRRRKYSETSGTTSEVPTASLNHNPDEIFEMSDLEMGEEDETYVPTSDSKGKISNILSKIGSSLKSRSQRSLTSLKSDQPKDETTSLVSEGASMPRSRELLPLIDELPESPIETKDEYRMRHPSKHSTISREVESDTQEALEELKFKREQLKVDQVPRSISLSGEKAANELGLGTPNIGASDASHGRIRTNSSHGSIPTGK